MGTSEVMHIGGPGREASEMVTAMDMANQSVCSMLGTLRMTQGRLSSSFISLSKEPSTTLRIIKRMEGVRMVVMCAWLEVSAWHLNVDFIKHYAPICAQLLILCNYAVERQSPRYVGSKEAKQLVCGIGCTPLLKGE